MDAIPVDFLLIFMYCYSHYYYISYTEQYLVNMGFDRPLGKSTFSFLILHELHLNFFVHSLTFLTPLLLYHKNSLSSSSFPFPENLDIFNLIQ